MNVDTTFNPTVAILNNSERGKALCKKYKKDLVVLTKNCTKMNSLVVQKNMSLDDVKNMYSILSSLENKVDLKKTSHDGSPPSETIAWYSHGASAGLAWSRMILKQKGILKSYKKDIEPSDLDKEDSGIWNKAKVVKSVNEELKQATFVVLQPEVPDAHSDIYSEEEIRKAKESFNKACMRANLFHMVQTDSFEFIESYISPADMIINGEFVTKGTWLATVQVHDDSVWQAIKDGTITGLSIGCVATVEYLEEDDE